MAARSHKPTLVVWDLRSSSGMVGAVASFYSRLLKQFCSFRADCSLSGLDNHRRAVPRRSAAVAPRAPERA